MPIDSWVEKGLLQAIEDCGSHLIEWYASWLLAPA
jgi:hypothetical protein